MLEELKIKVFEANGAHDVAALEGVVEGIDDRLETAESKLSGIEEGAQVNKIEHIKMNGADLTITDKRVDLGSIASDERVSDLEDRVEDAEDRLDVVQGADSVNGSIAKGDKEAAQKCFRKAESSLAKAKSKRTIKANTMARQVSRLAKAVKALFVK